MTPDPIASPSHHDAPFLRADGRDQSSNRIPIERTSTLSAEQVSLLTLVCDGQSDWTISRKTGLSLRTVQRRIQGLKQLLGVDSRAALAARAVELGCVRR